MKLHKVKARSFVPSLLFLLLLLCQTNIFSEEGNRGSNVGPDKETKASIDLDIDANYDGKIAENDDPIEESDGGLVPLKSTGSREPLVVSIVSPILNAIITYPESKIKIYQGTKLIPSGTKIVAGTYQIEGLVNSSARSDVKINLTKGDEKPLEEGETREYGQTEDVNGVTVYELKSVKVTAGATQTNVTGAKNWAAVKKANAHAMVEATIAPDIEVIANLISWSGGEAVEGKPKQCKVSKATSAKTNVKATLGSVSKDLDVWILWCSITVKTSGTTPPNAVQFGSRYDGTENLGAKSYDSGGKARGKVVPIATITPSGVHAVVKAGWEFKRDRWCHDFKNGVKSTTYYENAWTDDTSGASFKNETPDSNDKIYDRDAPSIGLGTYDEYETYSNFRQFVEWNSELCSGKGAGGLWYWKATWDKGQTPKVTLKEVGTGNIALPTAASN